MNKPHGNAGRPKTPAHRQAISVGRQRYERRVKAALAAFGDRA